MKEIKYKLYKWCIKKLLKWSRLPGVYIYDVIHEIYKDEIKEVFEGFNAIKINPYTRISDAIQEVAKDNIKIYKN